MNTIIIVGGGKLYRQTIKEQKKKYGLELVFIRKQGEKEYYNRYVDRTKDEQEALVQQGHDAYSTYVRYKNEYIGTDKPEGFPYFLWKLRDEGIIKIKEADLICSEDTLTKLIQINPDYADCPVYVLK